MEAKEIKRAIKKHGEGKNVSYDDKYFTHNMPEFMCIAEISFKAGREYASTEEGVKASIDSIIKRERLAGIREVLAWEEEHGVIGYVYDTDDPDVEKQNMIDHANQLKVWGV